MPSIVQAGQLITEMYRSTSMEHSHRSGDSLICSEHTRQRLAAISTNDSSGSFGVPGPALASLRSSSVRHSPG